MPTSPIAWPLDPVLGQTFTSDYGRTWWWDGCGWVASCCPPNICPVETGITLWFQANETIWGTFYMTYTGLDDNGNPTFLGTTGDPGNPLTLQLSYDTVNSEWVLTAINPLGYTTTSTSADLYGTYTGEGLSDFTGNCGQQGFPPLCMSFTPSDAENIAQSYTAIVLYDAYLGNPVYLTGDVGATEGGVEVGWDGTEWVVEVFSVVDDSTVCTVNTGITDQNTTPTGTYSCDAGEIVIREGSCECDTEINGITMIVSHLDLAGEYMYMPGYYNFGTSEYIIPSKINISYTLSFDGINTWTVYDDNSNPIATLTGTSPVGVYVENSEFTHLEIICGRPYSAICYSYLIDSPPSSTLATLFAVLPTTTPGGVPVKYAEDPFYGAGQSITWNSGASQWEDDLDPTAYLPLSDNWEILTSPWIWISSPGTMVSSEVVYTACVNLS